MNRGAGAVGGKRPAPGEGQYAPRKRPAGEDDDMIEEDFDMEPPEDDLDDVAAIEVRAGRDRDRGVAQPQGRRSRLLPTAASSSTTAGLKQVQPAAIHRL